MNCIIFLNVADYSCAYHRKLLNQGWLYVSISYCCFHSFVLGTETKVIFAMKDIIELSKEKRGLVHDSIKILTKNKTEHIFSNLFNRDETFELIEYLTNLAMQKLLKNVSTDPAPGLAYTQQTNNSAMLTSPAAILGLSPGQSLKESFDLQSKNQRFQFLFSIASSENIMNEISVIFSITGTDTALNGVLYLSESFLCFLSSVKQQCQLSIPFYAIMRVEKINSPNSTISITARHNVKILFQFLTPKSESDKFCGHLRDRLQAHVSSMKLLKPFLSTCASEELLSGKDISNGGLGMKFGFIESKRAVEKSKLRYWVSYFRGTEQFFD